MVSSSVPGGSTPRDTSLRAELKICIGIADSAARSRFEHTALGARILDCDTSGRKEGFQHPREKVAHVAPSGIHQLNPVAPIDNSELNARYRCKLLNPCHRRLDPRLRGASPGLRSLEPHGHPKLRNLKSSRIFAREEANGCGLRPVFPAAQEIAGGVSVPDVHRRVLDSPDVVRLLRLAAAGLQKKSIPSTPVA